MTRLPASVRHSAWVALLLLAVPAAAVAADPAVDARNYAGPAWSPYLVGAGIGVLAWATFYFSDKPIGASSFYASVAGLIGKLVAPRRTESLDYFKDNAPRVNWGFMFVVAAVLGAAAAAWPVGEQTNRWIPEMWHARFGESIALRGAFAFVGGGLMAFGARLAGGCTSGHGISGTLQLNVASWIAVICFFIGGAFVAALLFRT
ncbi:YeeE/YedE thiosulfate transporter family protein [Elioraea sp.]|uniref:YeeE/YedE thiosulfate transporter family protein n=1 Tax=Elioraea sp. TaxID=2185103 RepID=UPI0025BF0979|nr:YeeE/YedE thiosulfate transporter family protein [Elioraea sp.]